MIKEESINKLVEIDLYLSRTPNYDFLLLVAGFKEISKLIEKKNFIILYQKFIIIFLIQFKSY